MEHRKVKKWIRLDYFHEGEYLIPVHSDVEGVGVESPETPQSIKVDAYRYNPSWPGFQYDYIGTKETP